MSLFIDLTGERVGRLVVLRYEGRSPSGQSLWYCRCDCGVHRGGFLYGSLKRKVTQSCGCLRRELSSLRSRKNPEECVSDHPLYSTWLSIKTRCFNASHPSYAGYGARGITMCPEWRDSFEVFRDAVGERPDGMTLDRINNNGDYEPGNVRWATRVEQAKNTRQTLMGELNGESRPLSEVAEALKLNYAAMHSAMASGMTFEEARAWVEGGCERGAGPVSGKREANYRATSFNDLTGKTFGRWTVLHREPSEKRGPSKWWCRCECGKEKMIWYNCLTTRRSQSCGCLRKEMLQKEQKRNPQA